MRRGHEGADRHAARATLIALGAKRIGTRAWSTKYRGPLAIHAGRIVNERELQAVCRRPAFLDVLRAADMVVDTPRGLEVTLLKMHPSALVALCDLVDVVRVEQLEATPITPQEFAFGDYAAGRYAWKLDQVHALTPPITGLRGLPGLWDVPADVLERLHAAVLA